MSLYISIQHLRKWSNSVVMSIKKALSSPRLEGYRRFSTESDIECLKRYVWNVALSEALYPTIQFLEIALRNSIHNAATTTFSNDFWFDDPKIISHPRTLDIISGAKKKLRQERKPIESGRVVAELNFGFWRALFFNEYEKKLWRRIINDVFPNAHKQQRQRRKISPRIEQANTLRNRISHHEPIWHWRDLEARHGEMLETIEWISIPLRELVEVCDRFGEVYNTDIQSIESKLRKLNVQL